MKVIHQLEMNQGRLWVSIQTDTGAHNWDWDWDWAWAWSWTGDWTGTNEVML